MNSLWSIPELDTMTSQEVFDKGISHILKQGQCRNSKGFCVYDGPEGKTCVAGLFMKPEKRACADGWCGTAWSSLAENGLVTSLHSELLSSLQNWHDILNLSDPYTVGYAIAEEYNLSPAVLDEYKAQHGE